VAYEPPLDIPASVGGFRDLGDDLLDRWDGRTLVRTVGTPAGAVAFAATVVGSVAAPAVRVQLEDPAHRAVVEPYVRRMFVLRHAELAELAGRDPAIARLAARYPGVRPVLTLSLFGALLRAISAQQVNLRWAATTRRRVAERFGDRHQVAGFEVYSLDPARLAAVPPAELRALQFTTRKAEYIVGAAAAVARGALDLDGLRALPDAEVIARITAIRGLGVWTAEWILARTLGRPRVVAGDLGLRKAVGELYLGGAFPSEAEVRRLAAHWGAAAGVAQQLALHDRMAGAALAML
jgi:DNA-3-methyladenine glycosylase II